MAYIGKTYQHDRDENLDIFIDSLGLPADRAAGLKAFKPQQKLLKNGDTYTLVNDAPTGEKELIFQDGVELDETIADKTCKTTFTVDGDTVTQVQRFEDNRTITLKRDYYEDKLVLTITGSFWDGTAYRYYKAV